VVAAAVAGGCPVRGLLIGGALVSRAGWIGRVVSTAVLRDGGGSRVAVRRVRAHCWVLRKRAVSFGRSPRVRCGAAGGRVSLRDRSFVIPARALWGWGVWWRGGPVGRVLFVNCIVDASIFVAKLFRAHGGCLGIRSR
jgi:hypothetical protein